MISKTAIELTVNGESHKLEVFPMARLSDVGFGWRGIALQQIDRGQDHSGCTNTTLRAAVIDKCLLHYMKLIAGGDAFDGGDVCAINLSDWHETGIYDLPAEYYRACTAFAFAATFFGAGQAKFLTQHIQQTSHRKDLELV